MLRAARRSRPILVRSSPLPCVVLLACAFDSAGNGFPEGMSVGEGDTTVADDDDTGADDDADLPSTATRGDDPDGPSTTASTASTTSGTTADNTTDDDDDTSGDDHDSAATHSTSPDDDDSGSTGEPADVECPQSIFDVYWVEDGVVEAPMVLVQADAEGNPMVASSPVAESGSVTIEIDFACPGEYTLWGLVWDYDPGAWGEPDPDSFYFDVGGDEATWRYGCQTAESTSGLSWQRLASLSAQPCEASYIALSVYGAGTVELTLRNREAGDGSQVAGIAAIAVSDDPGANPATLYDPY
jgi:hypothetical protein